MSYTRVLRIAKESFKTHAHHPAGRTHWPAGRVRAQCWTTCRLHSAGLAAAACKRSVSGTSHRHSLWRRRRPPVRGLLRFRRAGRPTLYFLFIRMRLRRAGTALCAKPLSHEGAHWSCCASACQCGRRRARQHSLVALFCVTKNRLGLPVSMRQDSTQRGSCKHVWIHVAMFCSSPRVR